MSPNEPEAPQQQQIGVHNNAESRAYAAESTQRVSRANDGGAPPRDAPASGEMPEEHTDGTAGGNPVAGVEIDQVDRDDAIEPDQGAMEVDGPATGHA